MSREWESPISKFYRSGTRARFEAAAAVVINSRYDVAMDYPETLLDRFEFDRARGIAPVNLVFSLFRAAFRLGYLQGGKAAMKGKFKEPPRKRGKAHGE